MAVRFPIVLGTDDYTKRLHWHVDRARAGALFYFPCIQGKISFVSSEDAARFLDFQSVDSQFNGPINVCSSDPIQLTELMALIEGAVGKKSTYTEAPGNGNDSPFGIEADWFMNTALLQQIGFQSTALKAWLPQLIEKLAKS